MLSRAYCLLIFAVPLLAQQSTGELRLSVKDATGAGIPAAVDLVNQSTETHIAVQLASGGRYIFKNLPYGFYRLQIAQTGLFRIPSWSKSAPPCRYRAM